MKRKMIVLLGALVVGMGFQSWPLSLCVHTSALQVGREDEKKKCTTRDMVLEGWLNGTALRARRKLAYAERPGCPGMTGGVHPSADGVCAVHRAFGTKRTLLV